LNAAFPRNGAETDRQVRRLSSKGAGHGIGGMQRLTFMGMVACSGKNMGNIN